MQRILRPWFRSLSGVFQNLSVAFFGLAFLTPNFTTLYTSEDILVLTIDCMCSMLFLMLSVQVEHILEYA